MQDEAIKFQEALKILSEMHFGARVIQTGNRYGVKEIWWVTLNGENVFTPFEPETTWEYIINYAHQKLPVWDKAMMFEAGDIIEFDWQQERTRATVVDSDAILDRYILESPAFKKGFHGHRRKFGNFELKFQKNAVKVGELEF